MPDHTHPLARSVAHLFVHRHMGLYELADKIEKAALSVSGTPWLFHKFENADTNIVDYR